MDKTTFLDWLWSITDCCHMIGIKKYVLDKYGLAIDDSLCSCNKNLLSTQEYFLISLALDAANICKYANITPKSFSSIFEETVTSRLTCIFQEFDLNIVTDLSCEQYEKKLINSHMIVFSLENLECVITFDSKHQYEFVSENIHGIRKQIEMLSPNQCLVVEKTTNGKYCVKGICCRDRINNQILFDLISPGEWICSIPKKNKESMLEYEKLFKIKNGKYCISESLDIGGLLKNNDINTILSEEAFAKLVKKIEKVMDLNKGAIIVFLDDEDTIKRLESTYRMFVFDDDLHEDFETILDNIVNIDGAIICNYSCQCIGYGAILDGIAIKEANLQRGSRFNSTYNFIYGLKGIKKGFGIVVSDDGMIDVIVQSDDNDDA